MPVRVDLDEAIDGIQAAMVSALSTAVTAAQDESESESESDDDALPGLDVVSSIIRGDRTRVQPRLPALWVVTDEAVADHTTHGLAEAWTLPVAIAAVVSGDNPEEATRTAERLAARGRRVVLANRTLGLAYVQDVVSTRFNRASRFAERNRNLYTADAVVTVRFKIWEAS